MSNIFKKFEGLKVRVQITNSIGLPVDRQGYVEVEENWAYLYEKGQKGNNGTGRFSGAGRDVGAG